MALASYTWRCCLCRSNILLRRKPKRSMKPDSLRALRSKSFATLANDHMYRETSSFLNGKKASIRFCNVSSFSTELLELHCEKPSVHIIVIPGNPGIVSYYKDFVEVIYELLEQSASITAIGHISHTETDEENGRIFSLQDQIEHKVNFIKQELQITEVPIILVGHSIGSYICMEIFKKLENKVNYVICLYPFLTVNRDSLKQSIIAITARSTLLSTIASSIVSLLGSCPIWISKGLVRRSLGRSCSLVAVESTCRHLLKYHTMRNVLYMAKTEFQQLSEDLDWKFMKRNFSRIALLFGTDDHWGPLSLLEEITRQVPGISLSVETEGYTHSFCCTEAGSTWVARQVVNWIAKNHLQDTI